MRATVIHAPGDIRVENLPEPKILEPTDAIIRTVATCVCGSDLWDYRGINPVDEPHPMGHEYVGVVEEVGGEVTGVRPGQFVIGSFATSDNTCPNCRNGYQSSCLHREFMSTCQAEYVRVPHAEGTLVATSEQPADELVPSLLTLSDVMGTGWYAARAAEVRPGSTAVVVGDGAVGLSGVIAAKELGAERIIAMSRHESRQRLALEFGATDIVTERGEEGVARVKELTDGIGADSVLECVGTQESMRQALHATRPRRRPARRRGRRPGAVLLPRRSARRRGARARLPARPHRPRPVRPYRPGQGLRPHPAARRGRRGLPGHGRAPRHQGAAASLTREHPGPPPR